MAQNTRSQCSKTRGIDMSGQPLSEAEMEAFNTRLLEKEKQLSEQKEAMLIQQKELEKQRAEFEKSRNTNVDVNNLTHVLDAIQRDLSSLKSLNEQFQNLEKHVNDIQNNLRDSVPQRTITNTSPNNQVNRNSVHSVLPASDFRTSLPHTENRYSNSSIRDALELVPKYDGHNMPILQFARACKRAKELSPLTNENHLVRLLRNKLIGHAYLAVEDEIHDTIDQLIDSLKRTFGPARNSNYYRGAIKHKL